MAQYKKKKKKKGKDGRGQQAAAPYYNPTKQSLGNFNFFGTQDM